MSWSKNFVKIDQKRNEETYYCPRLFGLYRQLKVFACGLFFSTNLSIYWLLEVPSFPICLRCPRNGWLDCFPTKLLHVSKDKHPNFAAWISTSKLSNYCQARSSHDFVSLIRWKQHHVVNGARVALVLPGKIRKNSNLSSVNSILALMQFRTSTI